MKFSNLSVYLQKLEETTSRNTMIEILADLFKHTDAKDIDKVVYLMQGRVAPLYEPIEFGMADKMMLKAFAFAYSVSEKEILSEYKKIGDLGVLAEKLAIKQHKTSNVTISEVFENLKKVAETGGSGSVEKKMIIIADLLKSLDPLSARFVSRIPVAKLRLGFSDMTVLDALSWMIDGTKAHRKKIEPVFNIRPDLGYIAKTIKETEVAGAGTKENKEEGETEEEKSEDKEKNKEDVEEKIKEQTKESIGEKEEKKEKPKGKEKKVKKRALKRKKGIGKEK